MNKWFKFGILGLLIFGALAVVLSGTALAQDETPTPDTDRLHGWGRGFHHGFGGQVGLEAAAEVLGITTDELSNQLWAGETLASLAEEAGVDLVELRDAVEAARVGATRDAIEQAVEDEVLSRDHADWLLEGLDKGYWNGFGRGGRGAFHGPGFKGFGPPSGVTVTPSGDA